jgi:alkyl hydroperoxide reductase subunit AhpC
MPEKRMTGVESKKRQYQQKSMKLSYCSIDSNKKQKKWSREKKCII